MANSKEFWDRLSFMYNRIVKKDERAYQQMVVLIKKYVHSDMKVLELATGTGLIAFEIAPCCKEYKATDYSQGMLNEALKKPLPPNLEFSLEDAANLTFGDKEFDAVIISNTLHIVPEPEKVLQNIARVLKDEGLLIAPTFTRSGKFKERLLEIPMHVLGFKTMSKWTMETYVEFFKNNKWSIVESQSIPSSFPIAFVAAKKG